MSKYKETILTDGGLDLATRAANGKTKFTITKATATEDDLSSKSDEDLQKLVTLPNEIQTGSITNQAENIKNSKSIVGTEILFTNEHIDKGYKVNSVGLYAKEDGSDTEILYALNTAIEPEYMPDFADQVLMQFKITMYVIVGRTENVTVQVDPTNMASKEYVDTKIAKIITDDEIQDADIEKNIATKLAYAGNKSKSKNNMTKLAEIIDKQVFGLKQIDDKGELTALLPDQDGLIDVSKLSSMNNSGGHLNADNSSVWNGSISGRYQYWHGNSSLTDKTKIIFEREAGTKLVDIGDGFQFRIGLQKTLVTRGVVESSSEDIPLYYDSDNVAKDGYFVTTLKMPINIKKETLLLGKEIVVQLSGIGETNSSSQETKSPELHVQYDTSDNTITLWQEKGYEYDNLSDTKTGTIYDLSVNLINSYYVQSPVSQLPSNMSLFSGDTDGEVKLSGINSFFDNVGAGINVKLNDYIYISTSYGENTLRIALETLDIPSTYFIAKSDLISGNKVSMNLPGSKVFDTHWDNTGKPYRIPVETNHYNTSWGKTSNVSDKIITVTEEEPFIKIGNGSVNVSLNITSSIPTIKGVVKVTSVTN